MAEFRDDYVLQARVQGIETVDSAIGSITRTGEALKRLNQAATPLANPLQSLDKQLGLSSQTLASYDRLLRLFNDLDAAKTRLVRAQIQESLPLKAEAGTPQAQIEALGRKSAVQGAASAVDARTEAVFKELRNQIRTDLVAQERAEREAAKASATNAKNISRAGTEFNRTLSARTAAAERAAQEERRADLQATELKLDAVRRAKAEMASRERLDAERTKAAQRALAQAEADSQQSRLGAVDQALASQPVRNFPGADLGTHLGRAQSGVDQAATAVKLANLKLAEARTSETRTVASVMAAENRVAAADSALAASRERLALIQTRTSGSVFDQFRTGFKGTNADRSYAEQIGQAFKFSVFYGTAYKLLFGITQTFQATLQEGIQFQQAMTELNVAAGDSGANLSKLSDSLGSQAVQAGFAPSQGVLVGARSLGLFGVAAGSGASADEQSRVAEISARVVSRIAMGSGAQPADIQSNLAAIAQAFGTGAEGQVRAYDLDAYLTRKFGVAPGSTLSPVSEAGTVGKAAGFSQEQVTSIAADLMSRTGTTPEAVAGYMAQIFSRSGEGALVNLDKKYGVDPNGTLAQQLGELSKVYKTQPGARDEISAAFGRGKVQNAVIALLQDYSEVQKQASGAVGGATGSGDEQFKLRLDNLGGQLNITAGVLKDFADQLGQSGLLTDIGALLVIVRNLVQSATGLLREWNQLPGVIKATAVALAALAAASKLGAGEAVAGRLGLAGGLSRSAVTSQIGGKLYGPGTRLISPTFTELGAREAGAAVPLASRAGASTLARNAVNGLGGFGVATAVLADVYLWGGLANSTRKLTDAQHQAASALSQGTGANASPEQLRAHAANLSSLATQNDDAQNGLMAFIGGNRFGLGPHRSDLAAQSQELSAEAKRLQDLAKYKDSIASTASPSQALVSGFDSDNLAASMQAITASGGTAKDRLAALNATLLGTADASQRVQAAFDPTAFAGDNASSIFKALQRGATVQHTEKASNLYKGLDIAAFGALPNQSTTTSDIGGQLVAQALSKGDVQKRLQDQLSGITDLSKLDKGELYKIASNVVGDLPEKVVEKGHLNPLDSITLKRQMTARVLKLLQRQASSAEEIIKGGGVIDATQLTNFIGQQVSDTQELVDSLPQNDFSGRISAARSLVRSILGAIRHTSGGATDAAEQQLDVARKALAESQIARLEALRRAAQHAAHGDKEVAAVGRGFFVKEVRAAIAGGDADALANLVSTAGNYGKRIVEAALNQVLRTARAAAAMASEFAAFTRHEVAGIEGMMGRPGKNGGATSAQQHLLDQIHQMQAVVGDATSGTAGDDTFTTGSDAGRPGASAGSGETALQRRAALAQANATRSESAIQQARAAVLSARADMASAKKGTVEYYNALSSYYDARNQLTDAILEFKNNQYLLGHDITDPLVQARAQLRAAQAKLRSDAGKPADVRAADKVAAQQAQADVESQAFQQRLDAVTTAESLGRVSHSAYINYLNHEHTRLKNIAHRSYQQQQELNQIDQLLQTAADQMQGQWNFGDIKLPTPYQVRRYIDEHSGTHGGPGNVMDGPKPGSPGGDNHYVEIKIDGADTGQILKILRQYVGAAARTRTTGTRHR